MRKKLSYALAALSILFVLSAAYTPSMATTYTVGVTVGTTADYDYAMEYAGMYIDRIHYAVTGISGTEITVTKTEYNPDDSVNNTHSGTFDITAYASFFLFIGANLTVHDPIYIGSTLYIVNETITGYSTAGASRTVNHMNKTVMGISINAWWDKPTGLLVKWRWHQLAPSDWTVNYTLTSTSLWGKGAGGGGISIPTTYIIVGVGAVALIAIVAILLHKRK